MGIIAIVTFTRPDGTPNKIEVDDHDDIHFRVVCLVEGGCKNISVWTKAEYEAHLRASADFSAPAAGA